MSSPFAKVEVQHQVLDPVSRESHAFREQWTKDNPDIVCFLHAVRVELLMQYVMRRIASSLKPKPNRSTTGSALSLGTTPATHTPMG